MVECDEALADLVWTVRLRLIGVHVASRTADRELSVVDLTPARELAPVAERAVADGSRGYAPIVAPKPGCSR